jgi:NAD(P)-dependent dehydrogenase (short-subunit alcohol dehydrogenase family)
MDLKDKVVVITGGSKGLGKALALGFLKDGSRVVVCSKNEEELKNLGNEIVGIKADVTKENELQALALKVVNDFGKIDVWVNNAGIWLPHKPIEETDWKRAHDLIEVNLFGMVYGSKISLAQMRKQDFGTIVNIISTSGLNGKVNETAYCASKFAASGFTRSLAKEVDGEKIKVLGVYPGRMRTNLFDESKPQNYDELMDPNFVAEKIINNFKKIIWQSEESSS